MFRLALSLSAPLLLLVWALLRFRLSLSAPLLLLLLA
jgi:hypothetical protein